MRFIRSRTRVRFDRKASRRPRAASSALARASLAPSSSPVFARAFPSLGPGLEVVRIPLNRRVQEAEGLGEAVEPPRDAHRSSAREGCPEARSREAPRGSRRCRRAGAPPRRGRREGCARRDGPARGSSSRARRSRKTTSFPSSRSAAAPATRPRTEFGSAVRICSRISSGDRLTRRRLKRCRVNSARSASSWAPWISSASRKSAPADRFPRASISRSLSK